MEHIKVLIIGSGPAGFTAAIYTARANLQPVLYEGIEPGGQLTTTTEIENFPGYPEGVDGNQMMADLRRQAERFGTDIRSGQITRIDLLKRPFHVTVDGSTELEAEAVIVATGASAKYLGLPSETKFRGQGVSACATCDGFFYRKKDVAVVGGGDTACEEATYLASLCRKVYMIVRKPFLRASKAMQERVFRTGNIEVLFEHNTVEVLGDDSGVTGALLRRTDGEERTIEISGFFLAIGHHPNTELFAGQLDLDAELVDERHAGLVALVQAEVLERPVEQVDEQEHHDRAEDAAVGDAEGGADGARDGEPGEVEQRVANAGEGAHERGLDRGDGVLVLLVGVLLDGRGDAEDERDGDGVRVEVLEVALHRLDAQLLGSVLVELLENRRDAVGEREGLHALVVVGELAALGPEKDLVERLLRNLTH